MYLQVATTTMGLWFGCAHAATPVPTTATFAVNATVVAGCMVVGNPSQTTGVGFGMLDFGTHSAVTNTNINTSMGLSGGSMAQMQCTSGVAVTMTLDGGQNASGTQRRMKMAPNYYIPYSLQASASGNSAIAPGVGVTINTTNGVMTLPVWGIASPPGSGLPAGQYSDTVQVLFSW
ncbi:Csu type fimbrial protein [Rhodoferax saidenbachensis]|nr:spore coat U domain-containing protein [Rhodoferax saidenbachensis]